MELGELLVIGGAPESLTDWARDCDELEEAWDLCDRADHRIWLAAVGGASLDVLVEAAARAVLEVIDTLPEGRDPLYAAVEAAISGFDIEECRTLAETCEALVEASAGYRVPAASRFDHAARAAALLARAAEAAQIAAAVAERSRLDQASYRSALVGLGTVGIMPTDPDPVRFDPTRPTADPVQTVVLETIRAAADAVQEAASALAPSTGEAPSLDDAHGTLDHILRESLEE